MEFEKPGSIIVMLCRLSYFCRLLMTLPVTVKLSEKDKVIDSPSFALNALLNCVAEQSIVEGNLEKARCFGVCEKLAAVVRQSRSTVKVLSDFMVLVLSEIVGYSCIKRNMKSLSIFRSLFFLNINISNTVRC